MSSPSRSPRPLLLPPGGGYCHFPSLPLRGILPVSLLATLPCKVSRAASIFGAESWVLTGKMEAALDAFQGRVARRLTGRMPRRGKDGKWQYLPYSGTRL